MPEITPQDLRRIAEAMPTWTRIDLDDGNCLYESALGVLRSVDPCDVAYRDRPVQTFDPLWRDEDARLVFHVLLPGWCVWSPDGAMVQWSCDHPDHAGESIKAPTFAEVIVRAALHTLDRKDTQ